jgi:hypothetical protein
MKIKILLILILLITHCSLLTVTTQSQFQKTIGGTNHDYAYSIIQTTDSGYAVAGYTYSFSAGYEDMYVVKLNSSGSVQWTKTIGGAGKDFAVCIIQTTDNGYAISGYTVPYGSTYYNMVIVKLDTSGSIQWCRSIDRSNYEYATSINQTSDGGYILAGMSATGGVFTSDMFIVKLSSSGTYQWSKTYGGSHDEIAYSIIQTSDGGYAFAGYTNSYGPYNVFYILKIDSTGILQWSRLIEETGTGSAVYSVIQTTDGGFAMAGGFTPTGTGNYDMYIVKLNSSGSIQWTRTVGGTGDENANSIIQTSDGGFVAAGNTNSYGTGNYDMYIVKLNSSGTLQWSKTYGGSSVENAYSIIKSSGGGFVIAGQTASFGAGGDDIYLVKTDSLGNTCGNSTSPSSLYGVSGTLNTPTVSVVTQNPTVTTPTYITGAGGILTTICIVGIPPAPTLVSPPNGSYNQPSTVRFIWNKSQYAVSYRIQIALDSLFGNFVVNDTLSDSTIVVANLQVNKYYWWHVNAKNVYGISPYSAIWKFGTFPVGVKEINTDIPDRFNLYNNYPNPFNPVSKIKFDIAKTGNVKLIIYDVLGRELATLVNEQLKPGTYEAEFDGSNYPSGIYFYRLETPEFTNTKKMVLIK